MRVFPCPYLGGDVELTEERLHHIASTHPGTLPDYLDEMAVTLSGPDEVRPSTYDPQAMLFYKWFETIRTGRYLVVVTVSEPDQSRHWVITAYTVRKLSGG